MEGVLVVIGVVCLYFPPPPPLPSFSLSYTHVHIMNKTLLKKKKLELSCLCEWQLLLSLFQSNYHSCKKKKKKEFRVAWRIFFFFSSCWEVRERVSLTGQRKIDPPRLHNWITWACRRTDQVFHAGSMGAPPPLGGVVAGVSFFRLSPFVLSLFFFFSFCRSLSRAPHFWRPAELSPRRNDILIQSVDRHCTIYPLNEKKTLKKHSVSICRWTELQSYTDIQEKELKE